MRALVYKGDNWVECLTLMELALNNALAELTGMPPAHIIYGQSRWMPIYHLKGIHPVQAAAQDQVQKWEDIKDTVRRKLLQA